MCVVDFDDPKGNDWLAVNHVTVVENGHERHSDIVLFNLRGHRTAACLDRTLDAPAHHLRIRCRRCRRRGRRQARRTGPEGQVPAADRRKGLEQNPRGAAAEPTQRRNRQRNRLPGMTTNG